MTKKASPSARKLAEEQGVDIEKVKGTGPGGRIMRGDVLAAAAAKVDQKTPEQAGISAAPASADGWEDIPVSATRSIIARRLLESKTQIPHFYVETEVDAEPLNNHRSSLNSSIKERGPGLKFSVNDYILKATAVALQRVPAINVSWMGKIIRWHKAVHLAFAVSIEDGLVTPVIRDAHRKGMRQIGLEARELAQKARGKKLTLDEFSGSTFTVTNLGMFGVRSFYGIINPPNAAILAVGAILQKPVIGPEGAVVAGHRMALGLSGDHRAVDGTTGALFLSTLKEILENPGQLEI